MKEDNPSEDKETIEDPDNCGTDEVKEDMAEIVEDNLSEDTKIKTNHEENIEAQDNREADNEKKRQGRD